MNLLFNNKKLTSQQIDGLISQYKSKTKNHTVSFQLINRIPFSVLTNKGVISRYGGERQLRTTCTATLAIANEGRDTGILKYFEQENRIESKGDIKAVHKPDFLSFVNGIISFDYKKNPALFAFLLHHPECSLNKETSYQIPTFEYLEPLSASRNEANAYQLKAQAYNAISDLREENVQLLKALYEVYGGTDFDDLRRADEWDVIMAVLYREADKNPKKVIEQSKDLSMTVASKIQFALDKKLIVYSDATYFWTALKEGERNKKIAAVPTGQTDEPLEWFAGWIKTADKGTVSRELQDRIETYIARQKAGLVT